MWRFKNQPNNLSYCVCASVSEEKKGCSGKPEIMCKVSTKPSRVVSSLLRNLGSTRTPGTGSEAFTD